MEQVSNWQELADVPEMVTEQVPEMVPLELWAPTNVTFGKPQITV